MILLSHDQLMHIYAYADHAYEIIKSLMYSIYI